MISTRTGAAGVSTDVAAASTRAVPPSWEETLRVTHNPTPTQVIAAANQPT
ncbi:MULTISPECIES: hypothetical protein [Streptosporangium]|uniref:Uncharacterized protein n=1 Tax=Streptosporangium brasiliense TaxID=47480 RepID=A0ABT9R6N2_9ACTN|nr:hypothetical protein [Streptosporangium brasiliense]MDP9864517.1 hypothetical protein [Streptosporangium brasiliense]